MGSKHIISANIVETPNNNDYRQPNHTKMMQEVVTTKRNKRDKKQQKSKRKNKKRTRPKHDPETTMEAEDLAEQSSFPFTLLKVSGHAREQWSLRRTGAETFYDFLVRLEVGTQRFHWTEQLRGGGRASRWMVQASNGITLVLNGQKTRIITVLRDDKGRGYDYAAERHEQRLHSLSVDELPWSELFPDRPHQ